MRHSPPPGGSCPTPARPLGRSLLSSGAPGASGPSRSPVRSRPVYFPAVTLPSRPPPTRGRRLAGLALLLNGLLLVAGLYFEVHPRDRGDVWSAGGIVAIAVLNAAALAVARREGPTARFRARLRRIALLANGLLVAFALLLAVAESLRSGSAGLPTLVLVAPPLVTLLALGGKGPPGAGAGVASL
jgi:hypothetical protein